MNVLITAPRVHIQSTIPRLTLIGFHSIIFLAKFPNKFEWTNLTNKYLVFCDAVANNKICNSEINN